MPYALAAALWLTVGLSIGAVAVAVVRRMIWGR